MNVLLAAFLSITASGGFFADTQPLEYLAARDRLEIGRPGEALPLLSRALKREPDHVPSLVLYVRITRRTLGDTEAVVRVRRHLDRHPDGELLAELLRDVRFDTSAQLGLLTWADTRGIRHPDLWHRRLELLTGMQRWDDVRRQARRGLEVFPGSYELRLALGRALLERGRHRQAMQQFERLVRRRPGRSEPYRWLARSLLKRGLHEQAGERYEQYQSLNLAAPSWRSFRSDVLDEE